MILRAYYPTIGIIIYFSFYVYASTLYPGGSVIDINTIGYDWVYNYWCNLTDVVAINGMVNPARPIGITGMTILCSAVLVLFLMYAKTISLSNFWKRAIQYSGTISMIATAFIFSRLHDTMVIIAGLTGLIAISGIIVGIFKTGHKSHIVCGVICLSLLILNNVIYFAGMLVQYQPLIQKLSFLFVLVWFICLNVHLVNLKSDISK